ncbi:tandem-95 repeat protein [Oryzisolibacter sp. LB2S]|uniref:tandem-95 repeat protein n=1 Tax=Alicycliphilus soli TaxID=3228789 RepID=UPI00345774C0
MAQTQTHMEAVYKSGQLVSNNDANGAPVLDRPSIVSMKIAPEKVARYERRGDDLVLVLRDGQEVLVPRFFAAHENDGRNDLVLEDDAGVLWWGQYHGPWTEFHFTEIEWHDAIPLPLWLLTGLGVLGLGAAMGGGSGGGNLPPEAPSYQHTVAEDGAVSGRVVGRDPDGNTLSYTTGTPPSHGTVVVNPDGTYTYTPDPDYHGPDSFTVTVDDGQGGTTTSTVTIEVTPVNDPVQAQDDNLTTTEDTPLVLDLLGNDSAPDGGLHVTSINGTALTPGVAQDIVITDDGTPTGNVIGRLEIAAGGTMTFVPAPNYNGPVHFDYEVADADGDTASASVDITVTPVNDAPTVPDYSATTPEDTTISGTVVGSDVDGDSLTYTAGTPPSHGTVVVNPDGTYTYTPNADWNGTDSFTVIVDDGQGGTTTSTVTIEVTPVNDAPTVPNYSATTPEDTPISGTVVGSDVDGDTLTYTAGTPPSHGTVVVNPDGTYTYTPDVNYHGPDSFTVIVDDGQGGTTTSTVTIEVTPDAAPGITPNDGNGSGTTAIEQGQATVYESALPGGSGGGATQVNGTIGITAGDGVKSVTIGGTTIPLADLQRAGTTPVVITTPQGNTLTITGYTPNGTDFNGVSTGGTIDYQYDLLTPKANTPGADNFIDDIALTIDDMGGGSSSGSLQINIVDDGPSIGSPVNGTVEEKYLPTGSEAPSTPAPVQATGTLGVSFGADGAGDVVFTADTITQLQAEGLQSGGAALDYTLSPDGHTLTATAGGQQVFTVVIDNPTGPNPSYTFTLDKALNNPAGADLTPDFLFHVTDGDGDHSEQSFTVTIKDDGPAATRGITVAEDGQTIFTTSADGSDTNVAVTGVPTHGTATVNPDGTITYKPAANYSGTDSFTYTTTADDGSTVTTTVNVTVSPVADAPGMGDDKTVNVNEDESVSLGLILPTITDDTDQNGTGTGTGDNPERLGAITLTVSGDGASGVTLSTGSTVLTPVSGKITVVITDQPHISGVPAADAANGIYHLTRAEYQALQANPAPESGRNFTVTVSATSYEVDDTGAAIGAGASASQAITVDVQAVTDGATLTLNTTDVTFNEDATFDLSSYLGATLTSTDANAGNDTDGSETYWYSIVGLPQGTVVQINGASYTAGADGTVTSSSSFTATPSITVKPPANFSGDINGVTITLHTKDTDGDSAGAIAEQTSAVTVNLHVTPMADDVNVVNPAAAGEDSQIAFLAGISHTDGDTTGGGSERITEVSFGVPTGWTLTSPSITGVTVNTSGATATISFDAGMTQAQIETALDAFTIRPPAHSSKDATIQVTIKTEDTNTVNGSPVTASVTETKPVTVTVTPVAERTDSDSDGQAGNDVTMNGDHVYTAAGKEDQWFALGTDFTDAANGNPGDAGVNLAGPWTNEDSDEFTFAVLTPSLSNASSGDSVNGTTFRYHDGSGWKELVFNGEAVWVPSQYLNTLQVKAPPNVAGTLTVTVQAATVDYDDDADPSTPPTGPVSSGAGVNVQLSGSAELTQIQINPVADEVTLALNGHASGQEDQAIALAIKATSSDPSETITLTIADIPAGAVLTYDGNAVNVSAGSATIANFDHSKPLTITPPPHSNADFTLKISAVSVDGSNHSTPTPARDIEVSVKGVADVPVVTVAQAPTYAEAALDGNTATVRLSDLVTSVTSPDGDGSEVVSLRITGLAEGFTLTGATLVTGGTGTERVWTVPASQMANVEVKLPANFSGQVSLQVVGVTTENDGDSLTGTMNEVSFTVTPSAEGVASTSATVAEDVRSSLGLSIVHVGGDADERLGKVWIQADQVSTTNYTLYLMDGTALSSLPTTNIGGVNYVEIAATDVPGLQVQGAANLDGHLGSFNYRYEVIDDHFGTTATGPANTVEKTGSFTIGATAVTDAVDLSIANIDGTPTDTTTVTSAGSTVTVNLQVDSVDKDGSEHVIRVLIEGVPEGVTVVDGAQTGTNTWVLVYEGSAAKAIGASGVGLPVQFIVAQDAGTGSLVMHDITMTVLAQDNGDQVNPGTAVVADSVTWHLGIDLAQGDGAAPPTIGKWEYNGAVATEDVSFALSDVLTGEVTIMSPAAPNTLTVTVTDLPPGTSVSGMVLTMINGTPTWTASVTVTGTGGQAALDTLLAGITITPPADYNDNTGGFTFNASLHTSAAGGTSNQATTAMPVPVTPVTDEAVITVSAADMAEGAASIPVTITVADPRDGAHGQIVDGKLYVQVDAPGNAGGTLSQGGTALTPEAVTGVPGVPNGNYYVIDVGPNGGSVSLDYTPPVGSLQPGSVTINAYAQTQETGASNQVTGSGSDAATISIVNNGVTVSGNTDWTGNEPDTSAQGDAIALGGLSVALADSDGSETINTILLSGVPVGFLVYVGGVLANNAGGDGTNNTWVLSSSGALPLVSILPPAHWSGTLSGLKLLVESGETSLAGKRVDSIDLADVVVNAVANGLTMAPTHSFGKEGGIIDLNLNAKMNDPVAATATLADASVETTTLQITGLGEHAAFYIGTTLIDAGRVSHSGGTYTITGLSQADLDKLGFVQAASALDDQDGVQAGVQIGVTAWTVESATGVQSVQVTDTLDLQVSKVAGTTGADSLIWGGAAKPVIDGLAGDDTVALRLGEDVAGADLSLGLKNIETLDLSVAGANNVTGLTAADVLSLTDSRNTLTILGDAQDGVALSGGGWTKGSSSGGYTEYSSGSGASLVKVLIDDDITNVSYS